MRAQWRSLEIEPERFGFAGRDAGSDRLDRVDHAALAAEHLSASDTMRIFGVAVGSVAQRLRDRSSSRPGLSAQAVMNAPAVERLMPA